MEVAGATGLCSVPEVMLTTAPTTRSGHCHLLKPMPAQLNPRVLCVALLG